MRFLLFSALFIAISVSQAAGAEAPPHRPLAPLQGIKRVLFLGDSITYSGGYVDLLDAYVHQYQPDHPVEMINLGLPSETVSGLTEPGHAGGSFPRPDLHERLDRALAKIKPDLVVGCYGMNDGIYAPFDERRFAKYQEGIRFLRDEVLHSGAKLWLLTPPPFDPKPLDGQTLPAGRDAYPSGSSYEGYDGVLARYSDWLLGRRSAGWNVIDIHSPLDQYLEERRKADPSYRFANDGVHMNETAHRLTARVILTAWGASADTLPTVDEPPAGSTAAKFLDLIHRRQRILCDAWLTEVGHKRPGMPQGQPINQAIRSAADIEAQIRASAPQLLGPPSDEPHATRS